MLKDELQLHNDWIEFDLNPLITFDNSGKIEYTNNEAQFFLGKANAKQIFELALSHAPKTYGIATKFIDLSYGNYNFYAISIGYYDDEFITIKLYKSNLAKKENLFQKQGEINNLFTLLDIVVSTNSIKQKTKFIKNYDPSIPEFRISAKDFLKLLSSIFTNLENAKKVDVTVKLKVGEYIKIKDKKHRVVAIELVSDSHIVANEQNLEILANSCGSMLELNDATIKIHLPIILE